MNDAICNTFASTQFVTLATDGVGLVSQLARLLSNFRRPSGRHVYCYIRAQE